MTWSGILLTRACGATALALSVCAGARQGAQPSAAPYRLSDAPRSAESGAPREWEHDSTNWLKSEIRVTALSPDGRLAAYAVSSPIKSVVATYLFLIDVDKKRATPTLIASSTNISNIQWLGSTHTLAFVSEERPMVIQLYDGVTAARKVINTGATVYQLSYLPQSNSLVVATRYFPVPSDVSKVSSEVDDLNLAYLTGVGVDGQRYRQSRFDVMVIALDREGRHVIYTTPLHIDDLTVFNNDVLITAAPSPLAWWLNSMIRVPTKGDRRPTMLFPSFEGDAGPKSVRSGYLAFTSVGGKDGRNPDWKQPSVFVATSDGAAKKIDVPVAVPEGLWLGPGTSLWVAAANDRREEELVLVDWKRGSIVRRIGITDGSLSSCSLRVDIGKAICVAQSITRAPRIAVVNLSKGTIHDLCQPFVADDLPRDAYKLATVVNRFGERSPAILALPDNTSTRSPLPLAIVMYGFRAMYSRNAQWIDNIPVERMRASGIGVLLLNLKHPTPWPLGDVEKARFGVLDGPLATIDAASRIPQEFGFRTGRAMVMGWSYGGFLASHAMFRFRTFVAASIGNPAQFGFTAYVTSGHDYQAYLERMLGGPPIASNIWNYLAFMSGSEGNAPSGPIMYEGDNVEAFAALEYVSYWHAAGTRVHTFLYPDAGHAFSKPPQVAISQDRNLAWAKMNLLGRDSVSAEERERLGLMERDTLSGADTK